jgi:hypothetical protein
MARKPVPSNEPALDEDDDTLDADELDRVLAALRELKKTVKHPALRACLDVVRADIVYLADAGDEDDVLEEDNDIDDDDDVVAA